MIGFKTLIVSMILSASIAFLGAWKYQDHKFNREIENAARIHAEQLFKETAKTIRTERTNATITAEMDKKSIEANKRILQLSRSLESYRNSNRSLYIRANSCVSTGVTNSASSEAANPSSSNACELPRNTSDALIEAARLADEYRSYAELGHEYAKTIEKQRERLKNE
jgi:hypothetical protein